VPRSAIDDDRYFHELFLNGSLALAQSISRYLRGTWGESQAHPVIVSLVWEELQCRLRQRLAQGESCDPRLERIVKSTLEPNTLTPKRGDHERASRWLHPLGVLCPAHSLIAL
jgi:hypothetical protein